MTRLQGRARASWVLAALGVLLLQGVNGIPAPVPPQPLPDPLQQDDAGSGADAPDVFDAALPLATHAFQGVLMATPRGGMLGVHVHDRDDWYRFTVGKGDKVTVALAYAGAPQDTSLLGQLVMPDGTIATQFGAGQNPAWLFAATKGEWRVHVLTEGIGSAYSVQLAVEESGGFAGGRANPGYVAMGFDVPDGGQIWGQYSLTSVRTATVPAASTTLMLDGELNRRLAASWIVPAAAAGAHVRVGEQSHTTFVRHYSAEDSDTFQEGWAPTPDVPDLLIVNQPGRVYLVLFSTAEHVYFNYNLTFVGDVTFVGAKYGDRDRAFSRTFQDHTGTLGVQTPAGSASQGLSTSVDVRHVMLAYYHCRAGTGVHSCSVTPPSGETVAIPGAGAWFTSAERGTWTFHRDQEASAKSDDKVLLHGVLAQLP